MSNDASEAWTLLFRLYVSQRGRVPRVAAEFELSPMQAHVLRLLEPGITLLIDADRRRYYCATRCSQHLIASSGARIVPIP